MVQGQTLATKRRDYVGAAISFTFLCVFLVADALRDAFGPRLK